MLLRDEDLRDGCVGRRSIGFSGGGVKTRETRAEGSSPVGGGSGDYPTIGQRALPVGQSLAEESGELPSRSFQGWEQWYLPLGRFEITTSRRKVREGSLLGQYQVSGFENEVSAWGSDDGFFCFRVTPCTLDSKL